MWPFRKQPKKSQKAKFVPFASMDLSYAKSHGLRALCGLLMDRHSACTTCPFCGINDDDGIYQLIVHVEMQSDATTGAPLLALYFCKAKYPSESPEAISFGCGAACTAAWFDIEEWAARLTYAEAVPDRKAVVHLLDTGAYYAEYGPSRQSHPGGLFNRSAGPRRVDSLLLLRPGASLHKMAVLGKPADPWTESCPGVSMPPDWRRMVGRRYRPRAENGSPGSGYHCCR